jgi:L-arabinose isomerase
MVDFKKFEFWFIVGSQDLYGEDALQQVVSHARIMADGLNADPAIPGALPQRTGNRPGQSGPLYGMERRDAPGV